MERVDYQSLVLQDLINLNNAGELDLNPWYQRRSVWTRPQKSYLINTLFEKKPVPSCYIRHYLDIEFNATPRQACPTSETLAA
jgi:hypothetical protein